MRLLQHYTLALLLSACAVSMPAHAVPYTPDVLEFSSAAQSIWGTGNASVLQDTIFLGKGWNGDATIGAIIGSANTQIFPGTSEVTTTVWEPRLLNGCGCWKEVTLIPGLDPVVVDTRSGAQLNVNSSGRIGIELGYSLDAGSINSAAAFQVTADIPEMVGASQFFSIGPTNTFSKGTIATQAPQAEAWISGILEMSGTVSAQVCAFTLGCAASGPVALPALDVDQRILSIDPGGLKILDGLGDDDGPLAEVPILDGDALTLSAGIAVTGVGIQLSDDLPLTRDLINTMPAGSIEIDLATLEVNVPDVEAGPGEIADGMIAATGRDDILTLHADLDGLATLASAAAGFPFPLGLNLDLIDTSVFKFGASIDVLDVDAGPVLGLRQDFELVPTLMVDFKFSAPVQIAGSDGFHSSWSGEWAELPQFAISENTLFSPTFWVDAVLRNNTGLDLGLTGTWKIYDFGLSAEVAGKEILSVDPPSLNELLGLGSDLFETDKLFFSIFDEEFALGGFDSISAQAFLVTIADGSSVPEPRVLALMTAGLCGLLLLGRRRSRNAAVAGV